MKKNLLGMLALLLISSSAAVAQSEFKPTKGFGMEVGFSPLGTTNVSSFGGQLRGNYWLSESMVVRLGLGINTSSDKDDNGLTDDEFIKKVSNTTSFQITPGFLYMFSGTERLSPYVGAEIGIGMINDKEEDYTGNNSVVKKASGIDFGINLLTGFNYYFARNLYVGVEMGLGFYTSTYGNPTIETNTNGQTVTVESKATVGNTTFAPAFTSVLRLGWIF